MIVGQSQKPAVGTTLEASEAAQRARLLGRLVHALGLLAAIGYGAMTLSSFVQAAALWRTVPSPRAQAFFDGMAARLQQFWPWAADQLAAGRWPADNVAVLGGYALQLAVPTVAYMALLLAIAGRQHDASEATLASIRRWAVIFAVVSLPAYPVFTQDFWLSVMWGRMIAAGDNPFHRTFSDGDLAGLPLDHFPMTMSYGPLWGLVSGGVMSLSGDSILVAAILFKLILFGAWLGCLAAIGQIGRGATPGQRCLSMVMLGWAPAGVGQSLAEGHNDVAMVALILLWLVLLSRERWGASLALMGSVLCKYVSGPLFLVELFCLVRLEKCAWRRVVRVVAPMLAGLAIMAVYYRSPAFFDGLHLINDWHFLRPRDAIDGLGGLAGMQLGAATVVVMLAFPIVAAQQLLVSLAAPTLDNLVKLAIAVMGIVLFSAIGHVWPWYLIWGLGLAALSPNWWFSRFISGVSIAVPFTLVSWWIAPLAEWRDVISLGLYVFAILWTVVPAIRGLPSLGGRGLTPVAAEGGRHE